LLPADLPARSRIIVVGRTAHECESLVLFLKPRVLARGGSLKVFSQLHQMEELAGERADVLVLGPGLGPTARDAVVWTVRRSNASVKVFDLPGARLPTVLFVCVENAGRSQMAEAFARELGIEAASGGSNPADRVNPVVVEAMRERGIEISAAKPKGIASVRAADIVVTMGCGDACPNVPGRQRIDWDLPDPKGRSLEEVRAIRDEIERRVRELAAQIGRRPVASPSDKRKR